MGIQKISSKKLVIGLAFLVGLVYLSFLSRDSSSSEDLGAVKSFPKAGELTIHQEDKAYAGFTLVPVTGTAEIHLINMQGEVLHMWPIDADRARLLPNGNILVIHGSRWGRNNSPWQEMRETITEYNWEGEVVWEYVADDVAHHDLRRLPNGNTLFLGRAILPDELKDRIEHPQRRSPETRADSVIEVNPEGDIVWEWYAYDHLDLNYCGARGCGYLNVREGSTRELEDWTHINAVQVIPENKWYDAGDERFRPGNLILMPRNWWTVIIIDRETGNSVWEYNGDYNGGISGGHEPHMIEKGMPGEGNILVFDNGSIVHRGESYALEVNPVTKEVEWVYDAGTDFHSRTRGSLQRLPNGNTLISEDTVGRVFEVTPEKEIVWEYRGFEECSRAERFAYDYCEPCKAFAP